LKNYINQCKFIKFKGKLYKTEDISVLLGGLKMPEGIEFLHGLDEVQVHDFSHSPQCGKCGSSMKITKHGYECPSCHMKLFND